MTSPARSIGPPSLEENGWVLHGGAAQRLFDKSAIGRMGVENSLLLHPSEVIFCVRHRHMITGEGWIEEMLREDDTLLHQAAALEAMRVPGEKVILRENIEHVALNVIVSEGSWALRWGRGAKVKSDLPESEVIWVREFEPIDYSRLFHWACEVNSLGRIAEVLIVDEEFGVTTYRVSPEEPRGIHPPIDFDAMNDLNEELVKTGCGALYIGSQKLPVQLASPLPEGAWLEDDEVALLCESSGHAESVALLKAVLARGLLPRSGFKYGTRWRLYESEIGERHAEWLLQPYWLAPRDWGQACLAARLANGVHKTWLCGLRIEDSWRFLAITRPPASSRWSGFRH